MRRGVFFALREMLVRNGLNVIPAQAFLFNSMGSSQICCENFDFSFGTVLRLDTLDLRPGVVGGVAFNKNQLGARAHFGGAPDGVLDVARFVARRNDHGHGDRFHLIVGTEPGDREDGETAPREQGSQPTVHPATDAAEREWAEEVGRRFDGFPTCQGQVALHIR